MNTKSLIRRLVHSKYIDLLGILIILGVCIVRDFHGTYYQNGQMSFGIPISELWPQIKGGAIPLGIWSILGAIFSVLSNRLIGKQNNVGNMIGVGTSASSGTIDYLFGNHSAIITYPISLFLNSFSVFKWSKGVSMRKRDTYYYLIVLTGMILGFSLVYLGSYLFGGKSDNTFLVVVSLTFGISLGGNFTNAFKYEETWLSWAVYNVIQLIKNIMLLNIANVAKYIFYLLNSVATLADWKINGDVG
ncbi:MAG: nicotinamide mononucleotide transporter family protein [Saprospiraceae bacterium]